jgi:hypothetical protein
MCFYQWTSTLKNVFLPMDIQGQEGRTWLNLAPLLVMGGARGSRHWGISVKEKK